MSGRASGFLWLVLAACTDGTTTLDPVAPPIPAPHLVADLAPGPSPSFPSFLTPVDGVLYFVAFRDSQIGGGVLMRSEGTAETTTEVMRFEDYPHDLSNVGGVLMFTAGSRADWGIWRSDGSAASTTQLLGLPQPTPEVARATTAVIDGHYFVAARSGGRARDLGLYRTDGAPSGTVNLGSSVSVRRLVRVADQIFYFQGSELWVVDRVQPTARLVAMLPWPPGQVLAGQESFYFLVQDPAGPELWKSDGTMEGTVTTGVRLDGSPLFEHRGRLYFKIGEGGAARVLVTDTHGRGGVVLLDRTTVDAFVLGDVVQLVTPDETWRTDGTRQGTVLVDLPRGVEWIVDVDGMLAVWTVTSTGPQGGALWLDRGDDQGAELVAQGRFGATVRIGKKLYFTRDDRASGDELWVWDLSGVARVDGE